MKRIFTFLLSLLAISGFAQDAPDSLAVQPPYTVVIDSALHHLDKSRVPHGILYDRVYPFAQLTELEESDTISIGYFLQAFSELQRARYGELIPDSFLNPRNVRDFLKSENINKMLLVLVLNEQFSIFDSTSFADGRIDTLNGQYYDGAKLSCL